MGDRTAPRSPLAWQGTLAQMKDYGTRVYQTCTARGCDWWFIHDVDNLISKFGADYVLWDRQPRCIRCKAPGHYMASPGENTPFRPLRSSIHAAVEHREFILSFHFSRRDVVRIRAMAESVTGRGAVASLNDLDVPYRVSACLPRDLGRTTGKRLGEWAGRELLYWTMSGMERDHWAARRPGPRKV